jgi:hypothetical protein
MLTNCNSKQTIQAYYNANIEMTYAQVNMKSIHAKEPADEDKGPTKEQVAL